jgi:DMSO/TMAO reductase YedYZ molybdopterin-dependent catalytic subunit
MPADLDVSLEQSTLPPVRSRNSTAAAIGIVAGLATFGGASLFAMIVGGENPFFAVGSATIDFAPPGFKALVISLFGTNDKTFLFVLLGLVVLVAAAFVGILQLRKPPFGVLLLAFVGFLAALATITRAGASPVDALPSAVGVLVGWLVLRASLLRLGRWRAATKRFALQRMLKAPERAASDSLRLERRGFLRFVIIAGVASFAVTAGTGLAATASGAAAAIRAKIKLPGAATPAPSIPADAELHITGLSPYIVPNADFYRIDTALVVPNIDPDTWKLTVTGMVENEVEITFAELMKLPLQESIITLTCVSQEVGGTLIGNASWLGYPIRELLAKAKPKPGADMVLSTSVDGFTASSPLTVLQDVNTDALLAIGMNGQPLPIEHGFPVRMVVPGLYGYVSATKWLVELKVTTYADDQGYWTPRGYSAKAPIKLSSRIDTPTDGYRVSAGRVAIAGVAWHQHVGISSVEVQIDDGAWQEAKLARVVTVDSWLQWSFAWDATNGTHTITVRATDDNGEVQTARQVDVVPNGATGLHTIRVSVS